MDSTTKNNQVNNHENKNDLQIYPDQQWKPDSRDSGYSRNSQVYSSIITLESFPTQTPQSCVDPKLVDLNNTNSADDPPINFEYVKSMKNFFESVSRTPTASTSPSSVNSLQNSKSSLDDDSNKTEKAVSTEFLSNEHSNEKSDRDNSISNKYNGAENHLIVVVATPNGPTRVTLSNETKVQNNHECEPSTIPSSLNNVHLFSELLTDPNDCNKIPSRSSHSQVGCQSHNSSIFCRSVDSNEQSAPTILIRRSRYRQDRLDVFPSQGVKTFSKGITGDPVVTVDHHPLSSSFNIDNYLKENIITEVSLSKDDQNSYSSTSKSNSTYTFLAKKSFNDTILTPRKRLSAARTTKPIVHSTLTTHKSKSNLRIKQFFRRIFTSCLALSDSPTC